MNTAIVNAFPAAAPMQASQFDLHTQNSGARAQLERYIAQQYEAVYGAQLQSFLPILFNMQAQGQSQAALGLRPACCQSLFLEHYLNKPIEQQLAEVVKEPVARGQMIEVGNLAASSKGASLPLFVVMTAALAQANYQWMLFTATPEVEKLIKRLRYAPILLADARAEKLGEQADDWGRYYQCKPQVMAGDVRQAMQALNTSPRVQRLLVQCQPDINVLAQCLRDHRRLCGK